MNDAGHSLPVDRAAANRDLQRYLTGALKEIRRTAMFSNEVDWVLVGRETQEVVTRASTYADTHVFLAQVLRRAGGNHSRLMPAAHLHRARARVAAGGQASLPHGETP